uniref:CBS domain-containing protein n=1 Tax=Pararhizobium sp. IMCC3301 TaxID=3067904 RepID=UPI002740A252|nr:CBS domain-containing protein [Pararhizobium sp. IMCC3301]
MLVKDVMTKKVVTVTPETRIEEIVRLFLKHHISGVPVVDEAGAVAGLVSEGDLMRRVADAPRRSWWLELFAGDGTSAADYVKAHGRQARDVMTREMITLPEDTPVGRAAAVLEKHRMKRIPVLRDGKLVGIVSRSNLLQGLSVASAIPEPSADERVIPARILEALADVPGIQVSLVNVVVNDGVASIYGMVETISRPTPSAWPPKRPWAKVRSKSSWAAFRRGATAMAFDA